MFAFLSDAIQARCAAKSALATRQRVIGYPCRRPRQTSGDRS